MGLSSSERPLVFAHRGSSHALPEHTLGAYLRAVDEGADGLECDVRLTRDRHLVCLHDRRLERTSNGRGPVSEHTLAQLNELDFGSWHPGWPAGGWPAGGEEPLLDSTAVERWPGAAPTGSAADERWPGAAPTGSAARVLTLERLLDTALAAGRPIRLLVETKHPTRYGSEVEERLVEVLRRYQLDGTGTGDVRVVMMSFSLAAVRRVRHLAPELPTVLLMDLLPPWLRTGRLPAGIPAAGPGVRLLRNHPRLAARIREQGNGLYVWTVNTDEDIDLVLALGVDGIISDRPRHVLDRLGR
jgi:glycerophosphoryl diester phosphodiesterase